MKYLSHSFIAFVVLITTTVFGRTPGEKPRVFTTSSEALVRSKKAIMSNQPLVMTAYKKLLKEADKALQFGPVSVMEKAAIPPSGDKHDYMSLAPYHWPDPSKPNGLPYMRKDGETNPEVKQYKDKEYLPSLFDKVYKLALAYYFSGEKGYADHAEKLISVWFLDEATRMNPNMKYAQAIKGENEGRGAGLIDARHLMKVIDAVGLLQSYKGWTPAKQKGMETWAADFLTWMENSPNGKDELDAPNNHGIWYDALRLSLALFTNQSVHAKEIVQNAQARLDNQMDNAGQFPKEMARTTSLHYTVFALDAFFKVAQMAPKVGVDFWNYQSPSGKSLKKGFNELLPYLAGKKQWTGPQIKPFESDEAYPLLVLASAQLSCTDCTAVLKSDAGESHPQLLTHLIY